MHPHTRTSTRRRLLLLAACGAALAGCQTPPPPPPAPAPPRAAVLQQMGFVRASDGWELNLGVKLLFAVDDDALPEASRAALLDVAHALARLGVDRVRIEGHSDNSGSEPYNQALSLRRAETVAREFVKAGWIDAAVECRGFGSLKPVASNATADGRAQNRRVALIVPAD